MAQVFYQLPLSRKIAEFRALLRPASILRNLNYSLRKDKESLPIPSYRARFLVAGTVDIPAFLDLGKKGFDCIMEALRRNSVSVDALHEVLDFGCGCGRVLRYWGAFPEKRIYGTDINDFLTEACQNSVPFARVGKNQLYPRLDYPDASFDLIYAFSVFTHWDVDGQNAWIEELYRLLRPNGVLLISTHGEAYKNYMSERELADFNRDLPVVRFSQYEGENRCVSFLPRNYMLSALRSRFEVLEMVPNGARGNPEQDLYVLRRARPSATNTICSATGFGQSDDP